MHDAKPVYALAVILSLLEFHVFHDHHLINEAGIGRLMIDVTQGHAYWRAFQNRLIGPWAIRLLDGLLHSEGRALLIFAGVGMLATNILAAWLSLRYLKDRLDAAIALALFVFAYVMLFDYWTYPWDFIEVITFLLFAYLTVEGRHPLLLAPLFVIAVVNRESCLFIGAWYGIYAVAAKVMDRNARLGLGQLGVAAVLIGIAAGYTMLSRRLLFIASPSQGSDVEHQGFGNHLMLIKNLETGNVAILTGFVIFSLILIVTNRYAAFAYARRSLPDISLAVLIAFVLLQMLLFAVLAETRTFYTVLPLVFVAALRWRRDTASEQWLIPPSSLPG